MWDSSFFFCSKKAANLNKNTKVDHDINLFAHLGIPQIQNHIIVIMREKIIIIILQSFGAALLCNTLLWKENVAVYLDISIV
jgi:hypothetical protein